MTGAQNKCCFKEGPGGKEEEGAEGKSKGAGTFRINWYYQILPKSKQEGEVGRNPENKR